LTAIIEREGSGFTALCPEVDVASRGDTVEEARDNLREALELCFEAASPDEVSARLRGEIYARCRASLWFGREWRGRAANSARGLPFPPTYAGLFEQPLEEVQADFGAVRVGKNARRAT